MPKKTVEVELISMPDNLLDTIYVACRTCYCSMGAIEIYNNLDKTDEDKLTLINKVIASGHYSTIEHIQVTFAINNISRAATHQLVRHRHCSFSQKSQRYVKEKNEFDYVIPTSIEARKDICAAFEKHMDDTYKLYNEFIKEGIKAEDARSILPNAATSSLVVSMNLRELIHLANLRLCTRAQYEIRLTVRKMCTLVEEKAPWLACHLVPKCERLGYCDEENSCGKMRKKIG